MIGDELGVEQPVVTGFESRHQVHKRDFGGVARAVEHALAEEGAAKTDTIEAANQVFAVIDLDGMAIAALVELAIKAANASIDPGSCAPSRRLGRSRRLPRRSCY